MQLLLQVPFRDAAASDLAWSLLPGAAAPAALARLDVPGAGPAHVRLHVLGASHAVEATLPSGVRLTEVVAYGAPDGRTLASAPAELVRDGLRYRFGSTVERHASETVAQIAQGLHEELTGAPDALLATFPGAPGAATGLRALTVADGVGWETWHLYPERGEVVTTRTTVVPADAGASAAEASAADAGGADAGGAHANQAHATEAVPADAVPDRTTQAVAR